MAVTLCTVAVSAGASLAALEKGWSVRPQMRTPRRFWSKAAVASDLSTVPERRGPPVGMADWRAGRAKVEALLCGGAGSLRELGYAARTNPRRR